MSTCIRVFVFSKKKKSLLEINISLKYRCLVVANNMYLLMYLLL